MNTHVRHRLLLAGSLTAILVVGGIGGYQCLAQRTRNSAVRILLNRTNAGAKAKRPLQSRPKTTRIDPRLKSMSRKGARKIGGKIVSMKTALGKRAIRSGRRQRKLNVAAAKRPAKGRGQQRKKAVAVRQSAKSHLKLTLRITSKGAVSVVNAVECPGAGIPSRYAYGRFVYEVSAGGKTVAVGTLNDMFEMHGLPGPGHPAGAVVQTDSATVRILVPNMSLGDKRLNSLAIRGYKLRAGIRLNAVNPAIVARLRQGKKMTAHFSAAARTLAPQIRGKARSLRKRTNRGPSVHRIPTPRGKVVPSRVRGPF